MRKNSCTANSIRDLMSTDIDSKPLGQENLFVFQTDMLQTYLPL